MSGDDEVSQRRKVLDAIAVLWDWLDGVKTWKAVATTAATLTMIATPVVREYNEHQDKRRLEWIARSEARRVQQEAYQADVTNRLERIEKQGEQPKPAGGIQ